MTALVLTLIVVGVVLLIAGLGIVALAPVLATRMASATVAPKLERRASGPDRMRTLIHAQRTERSRSRGLATTLTRTGLGLAILSVLSLVGGGVAFFLHL